MENLPIAEYGVAALAVGALVWIVRAFLAHLKSKDETFSSVINNHLDSDKKVKEELKASNHSLEKEVRRFGGAIDKLVDKL